MTRLKNLLTALVLLAACGITLAAAVRVVRQPLEGQASEQLELRTWIIDRDLSQETPAKRAQIARRFEREFRDDDRLMAELRNLDPQRRQAVQQNVVQLLEPLFVEKAREYHRRPEHRRQAYLDRELDRLLSLMGPRRAEAANAARNSPMAVAALALLNQQIERWIERADPELKPQLREFATALQSRWFERQIEETTEEPQR